MLEGSAHPSEGAVGGGGSVMPPGQRRVLSGGCSGRPNPHGRVGGQGTDCSLGSLGLTQISEGFSPI